MIPPVSGVNTVSKVEEGPACPPLLFSSNAPMPLVLGFTECDIYQENIITYNFYFFTIVAAPVITTTLSTVYGANDVPLTLSCTSEGSPPDIFTWMKDGVIIAQYTSAAAVDYTRTTAIFRSEYTINRFSANDVGVYSCTVKNPIGNDTHNITVGDDTEISQLICVHNS